MMNLESYEFYLEFKVRDYECDMDGVVNNAQYLHYLEHTRNVCMKSKGLTYREMTLKKDHIFIVKVSMEFKLPLGPDDEFVVALSVERSSNAKMTIYQDIYRLTDQKLILKAEIVALGVTANGSYRLPQTVIDAFPLVRVNMQN